MARVWAVTSIPTTRKGYHDLQVWASRFGHVKAFGIEGTGSFGAGLSRDLLAKGHKVLDVMRPLRQLRYLHGKSDSLDAESAARSVLNGQATAFAKTQTGPSEMIRHLKVARDSAVKAKSQAMITLKTLIVNAPADLRETLDGIRGRITLVRHVVEDDHRSESDFGDEHLADVGCKGGAVYYRQCNAKGNVTRGMAPLMTHGAISASLVSPAIRVCVPRLPNGASIVSRSPRLALPRSRVMFVFTAVSSTARQSLLAAMRGNEGHERDPARMRWRASDA